METFGEATVMAVFYMYFVSLAAGLGLLTAAGVGFGIYNKKMRRTGGRKR